MPETLIEAVKYFSDYEVCHNYMLAIKWPNGKPTCPKCGGENIGYIVSRKKLQCRAAECRKQFSVKLDTIFEDSPLGLDKWFVAVWCIANAKNGISSCELARATGVTQKTAWHMLHRIRLAMETKTFRKLNGEVESDETFIGGAGKNMHEGKRKAKGRGSVGKAIIQGLLERGGRLRRIHGDTMSDKAKPPKGLEAFDSLLSKLSKVPKAELNAKINRHRRKKGK